MFTDPSWMPPTVARFVEALSDAHDQAPGPLKVYAGKNILKKLRAEIASSGSVVVRQNPSIVPVATDGYQGKFFGCDVWLHKDDPDALQVVSCL